jgi:segregation and condensation protein B
MSPPLTLEAILFAGAKAFSVRRLSELCGFSVEDVEAALTALDERLASSSIMLQRAGNDVQLVTRPEYADAVKKVAADEVTGELTRASLEALTILAYRGPLTRPELEQIRGVHSSIILRNLELRGLIEEKEDTRLGQPVYAVTFDFIRHLGLKSVEELPKYDELRGHENVVDMLRDLEEEGSQESGTSSHESRVTSHEKDAGKQPTEGPVSSDATTQRRPTPESSLPATMDGNDDLTV